jgi:hypothetical protein
MAIATASPIVSDKGLKSVAQLANGAAAAAVMQDFAAGIGMCA